MSSYANPSANELGLQTGQAFAADLQRAGMPGDEVARLVAQHTHPPNPPLTETVHLGDPLRQVQVTLTPVTDTGGQAWARCCWDAT